MWIASEKWAGDRPHNTGIAVGSDIESQLSLKTAGPTRAWLLRVPAYSLFVKQP